MRRPWPALGLSATEREREREREREKETLVRLWNDIGSESS